MSKKSAVKSTPATPATPTPEAEKPKKLFFNEMRQAFINAREDGNRHAISEDEASLAGCSPLQFTCWKREVEALYELAKEFNETRSKYGVTKEQIEAAEKCVFAKWRSLLEFGEQNDFEHCMRIREQDLVDIAGYAQKVVNSKNNTEGVEGFRAKKQKANAVEGDFRKFIEMEIGLRIDQTPIMTDARRDFLAKERKLMGVVKKANKAIVEQKEIIDTFKKLLDSQKPEVVAEAKAAIETAESKVKHFLNKIDETEKKLAQLRAEEPKA